MAANTAQYVALVGAASGVALNGRIPANLGPASNLPIFLPTQIPTPASFVPLNSLRGNYPVSEGTSIWGLRLDHRLTNAQNIMARVQRESEYGDGHTSKRAEPELWAERTEPDIDAAVSRRKFIVPAHMVAEAPRGMRSATCSTARCSEPLISSPRNIASMRSLRRLSCASRINSWSVSSVMRFFEKSKVDAGAFDCQVFAP